MPGIGDPAGWNIAYIPIGERIALHIIISFCGRESDRHNRINSSIS